MIDLKDVTFLIPLRIENAERKKNIEIQLKYLLKYFNTNIIILESSRERRFFGVEGSHSIEYHYEFDTEEEFYAAGVRNSLARRCKTPLAAIWDADFIPPVFSIVAAIELLRRDQYDAVYPFNGEMFSTDPVLKNVFEKLLDTMVFENISYTQKRMYGNISVGGGLLINALFYTRSGMENPNIKMWGNDDLERYKRLEKLGCRIHRVNSRAWHLHHPPFKPNDSVSRMKSLISSKIEVMKMCTMPPDKLREYVDKWNIDQP